MVQLGSKAFNFRDGALLINQVSDEGHALHACLTFLTADRASIGSGNAKRISQTVDFFYDFRRGKNRYYKEIAYDNSHFAR